MKIAFIIVLFSLSFALFNFAYSQAANNGSIEKYFHDAAKLYINNKKDSALQRINAGLKEAPEDQKLNALAKKILEEQKKQKQQKKEDQANNQDKKQDKKEEQKQEQEKKGDQKQDEQKQAQQQKQKISKEDAEKMLQALSNDEKNAQKKLMKKPGVKVAIQKQW